jgi:hypothetical protein
MKKKNGGSAIKQGISNYLAKVGLQGSTTENLCQELGILIQTVIYANTIAEKRPDREDVDRLDCDYRFDRYLRQPRTAPAIMPLMNWR